MGEVITQRPRARTLHYHKIEENVIVQAAPSDHQRLAFTVTPHLEALIKQRFASNSPPNNDDGLDQIRP